MSSDEQDALRMIQSGLDQALIAIELIEREESYQDGDKALRLAKVRERTEEAELWLTKLW